MWSAASAAFPIATDADCFTQLRGALRAKTLRLCASAPQREKIFASSRLRVNQISSFPESFALTA